jgi:hypothetical protein
MDYKGDLVLRGLPLTWKQVAPGLPPEEVCGSVDASAIASPSMARYLEKERAREACVTWSGRPLAAPRAGLEGLWRRRAPGFLEGLWQRRAPGLKASGSAARRASPASLRAAARAGEAGWATRMPRKHQRRRRNVVADEGTAYGLL